jgi:hypothetical protein
MLNILILPSQWIISLKLSIFLFNWEVTVLFALTFTYYKHYFLRDIFLCSFNCAERRPCSLFGIPQVSLQSLCGCAHQNQLGSGPSSLLLAVSIEHLYLLKSPTHCKSVILK